MIDAGQGTKKRKVGVGKNVLFKFMGVILFVGYVLYSYWKHSFYFPGAVDFNLRFIVERRVI